jgi:hypothetical protein
MNYATLYLDPKSVFLKSTATAKTFPEAGLRAKNAVPGR